MTKNMATKIGESIGQVLEVGCYEMPDRQIIMKAKILFDLEKSIKKGANTGSKADGIFWVDFKYEKLPQFCFYCGKIDHGKQGCIEKQEDNQRVRSRNLGQWLRTSMIGRKILDNQSKMGKKLNEIHENKMRRRCKRKFPNELVSKLATMPVNEKERNEEDDSGKEGISETNPSMQNLGNGSSEAEVTIE